MIIIPGYIPTFLCTVIMQEFTSEEIEIRYMRNTVIFQKKKKSILIEIIPNKESNYLNGVECHQEIMSKVNCL